MKKKILFPIVIILLVFNYSFSQCYPDRHSTTWYDGWISCQIAGNPNMIRGKGHFIMYELDKTYHLFEMNIWNMNAPDLLDYGFKDVIIDISIDGTNWTEFGNYTFSQASGENNFEGVEEVNFQGEEAKFILITGVSNYGGSCYGLSEIKVRARDICHSNIIAWIGDNGDWNVASNWCNDQIPTIQDSVWIPPNKNILIPSSYTATALWLDVGENTIIDVNGNLNIAGD